MMTRGEFSDPIASPGVGPTACYVIIAQYYFVSRLDS